MTEEKRSITEAAAFKAFVPNKRQIFICEQREKAAQRNDKQKPTAAYVGMEPSPIPGLTKEQYEIFLKNFSKTRSVNKDETRPVANITSKYVNDDEWVVDSGATDHITHRIDILENRTKNNYERPVIIPNGDTVPVEGRGDYTLPGGDKIEAVLYIPKFKCNLLSVSRLSKDLQCAVTFFPDFCVMQGLRSKSLIGAGECRKGLYRMSIFGKRKAMATTVDTWHKRLGHASKSKLAQLDFLKKISFKNKDNICDSCEKAKNTRQPFPTSSIKTNGSFELLHCDIWGRYRTPSFTSANYFLTIVDDFSRAVWVFLIKHKSDASRCLIDFHKMVENRFEKRVKRVRCDNGGEFTSKLMVDFYAKQGILLETTCPHTPQQNGVVERKHRHLLETARALMFEANLPKRFWGECILTAAYVINRLPSEVLRHKTPYELLFDHKPDYDHMRVFGCLTYYRSNETRGDKFEWRGRPGVFMGYPPGTKGYKIFDLEKRKIVISRDTRFHENHFPFSVIKQNEDNFDVFKYPSGPAQVFEELDDITHKMKPNNEEQEHETSIHVGFDQAGDDENPLEENGTLAHEQTLDQEEPSAQQQTETIDENVTINNEEPDARARRNRSQPK